jgi:hypothetical protein
VEPGRPETGNRAARPRPGIPATRPGPARKLTTAGEFDVQLEDPKKEHAFAVSVLDDAQVRHAYAPGVLTLELE